jgi:RNA polymerase-binding transcription factor DksA
MTKCIHCNEEIHPKRLEILPNAKTCVACSTTQKKGGLTVMKGTGDHTWIETIPMEHDDYQKIVKAENKFYTPPPVEDEAEEDNIGLD